MTTVYEVLKLSNTWAVSDLDIGLNALLQKSNKTKLDKKFSTPPNIQHENDLNKLDVWFEINTEETGLSVTSQKWKGKITKDILATIGVGAIRINMDKELRFLLVSESNANQLSILNRGGSFGKVSIEYVEQKLISAALNGNKYVPPIAQLDESLPIRVKEFLAKVAFKNFVDSENFAGVWSIELSPNVGILKQLTVAGFHKILFLLAGLAALNYFIFLLAWKTFSEFIFGNYIDIGGMVTWTLLLITAIPINVLFSYKFGEMGIKFSLIFKRLFLSRLMYVPKNEIKKNGTGVYLGAVSESENIESSIFQGANAVFIGVVQAVVLIIATLFHPILWYFGVAIVLWTLLIVGVNYRFYKLSLDWSLKRLEMTGTYFERIQGLLTERIQRSENDITKEVDLSLVNFYKNSSRYDGINVLGELLPTSAWTTLSCVLLLPLVIMNQSDMIIMAFAVGIIILSTTCFSGISNGLKSLIRAIVAYKQVSFLIKSTKRKNENNTQMYIEDGVKDPENQYPIVSIKDLDFRYKNQSRLVLEACKFDIYESDRIILSGKSGGGKSTLAKILNLENAPLHGTLLLNGLDRTAWHTIQWRKKIVYVPQFHSNYIFTASFAYNLLMADQWPASRAKIELLIAICSDLGLEGLLNTMPEGIWQNLGESGWQLSHGEKSRLYIARGILQDPDVLILDESLAAVDPDTGDQVLSAIDKYVKTCVMIAHA